MHKDLQKKKKSRNIGLFRYRYPREQHIHRHLDWGGAVGVEGRWGSVLEKMGHRELSKA